MNLAGVVVPVTLIRQAICTYAYHVVSSVISSSVSHKRWLLSQGLLHQKVRAGYSLPATFLLTSRLLTSSGSYAVR